MSASYRFLVRGHVQGVFFRQSAAEQAEALRLRGWVRNRLDGSVEGVVQGDDPAALDAFRRWLQRGPPSARVDEVAWSEAPEEPPAEPAAFVVRR